MRLSRCWTYVLLAALVILPCLSFGQNGDKQEDYYLFPIRPGIRNTLAGTMGELRSSHFHTGIDIRTGGVQGVPVQAAANGTLSRIVVSPAGYGNALYLLHPNGETTVYGHLSEFAPEIQVYVRQEQYKRQTFQINLFPPRDKFQILRGDTIALSGNSGSSGGPHLHFDIRDKNQSVLNPLKYNFEEIRDTQSPEVLKIALKTMDMYSRVNNQFGWFEFDVKKKGENWIVDSPISVFGRIGVEIFAYDRQDGTRFRTGINEIQMKLDSLTIFSQVIDNMSFSKSRDFYGHINYSRLQSSGERFHKLYIDDGNELDFYTSNESKGIIHFNENCNHLISIDLYDTYRNHSGLLVSVICSNPLDTLNSLLETDAGIDFNSYKIMDNTMIIYADQRELIKEDIGATIYVDSSEFLQKPFYTSKMMNVYLWDLREGVPDSIEFCNSMIIPDIEAVIPSGVPYKFYSSFLDATFTERSLFDTAYLHIHHQKSFMEDGELFIFGIDDIPVRSNIKVKLKPAKDYTNKDRTQVYSIDDSGNFGFAGGEWFENNIEFTTRNFGSYTLLTDTIPPEVKPLIINHENLVFRIDDSLSGIKEFNMLVDGEWVLMNYEPKKSEIWSEKLDPSKPFEGNIVLSVTDNAGNEKLYKTKLADYESANR